MFNQFDLRLTSVQTHPFTVIDREKVILKVVNPTNPEEMLAVIYLWQEGLAKTLRAEFETIWDSAKPLKLLIGIA
jgi:hypothetical protein